MRMSSLKQLDLLLLLYNFTMKQARIQGGFFGDWRTPPRLWKGPHFDFQFFSFSIIERAKNE